MIGAISNSGTYCGALVTPSLQNHQSLEIKLLRRRFSNGLFLKGLERRTVLLVGIVSFGEIKFIYFFILWLAMQQD